MNNRVITVLIVCSIHFLIHSFILILSPILLELKDYFNTSISTLSFWVTFSYFAFGFSSLPAGKIVDKIGALHVLKICLISLCIGSILILSTNSMLLFIIGIVIIGLAAGLYHPAGLSYISFITDKNRAQAMGYHGVAGSSGLAISPFITALITNHYYWKYVYGLYSIASFLVLMFLIIVPNNKSSHPLINETEHEDFKIKLFNKDIILILIFAFFNGLIYRSYLTFLPTLFRLTINFNLNIKSILIGGSISTIVLIFGVAGQFLGGKLASLKNRIYIGRKMVLIATISLFLMALTNNLLLILVSIVFTLLIFGFQPLFNYLLSIYSSDKNRGLIYGISFFISFGMGSISVAVSGKLLDLFNIQTVFLFCGFLSIVNLFIIRQLRTD